MKTMLVAVMTLALNGLVYGAQYRIETSGTYNSDLPIRYLKLAISKSKDLLAKELKEVSGCTRVKLCLSEADPGWGFTTKGEFTATLEATCKGDLSNFGFTIVPTQDIHHYSHVQYYFEEGNEQVIHDFKLSLLTPEEDDEIYDGMDSCY